MMTDCLFVRKKSLQIDSKIDFKIEQNSIESVSDEFSVEFL